MTQTAALASDLRTRDETARRLRVSTVTLDIWTKSGTGPAPTRTGGRVFFREAEIERFLRERTRRGNQTMESSSAPSLASIIEAELVQRSDFGGSLRQQMLSATAGLAASIRRMDLKIRERGCSLASARQFISAIESLIRNLDAIGGTDQIAESLAEEIAIGGLQTAVDTFPHLLPSDLRPPQ